MVSVYIGYFVIRWFGCPTAPTIAVPLLLLVIMFMLAAGLVGGLGVAIERFAYRPLRDAPLITAISISFFLENSALLLFGARPRIYNTPDLISFSSGIQIGSVSIAPRSRRGLARGIIYLASRGLSP
jgi:branched-chain amino acid transport system permease protein